MDAPAVETPWAVLCYLVHQMGHMLRRLTHQAWTDNQVRHLLGCFMSGLEGLAYPGAPYAEIGEADHWHA